MAWNPLARSLTEPFENRRYVHLVRLVVAGQHVHDEIDPKAQRHLALWLAARHDGIAPTAQAPAQSLLPTMTLATPSLTRSSTGSTQTWPVFQRPGNSCSR